MNKINIWEDAKKAERKRVVESKRLLYGKYRGYWRWDLACHWFKTTNDIFFEVYGFNFTPNGKLFEDARDFVHNS